MAFTVFHIEKGKGSGGGLGNHIDRVPGKEHSFRNANLEVRSGAQDLNFGYTSMDYCQKPLAQAINDRISEGYKGEKKIRSDAVKYLKVIFSGSHDKMKEMRGTEKFNDWLNSTREWCAETFGKENIVRFTLHVDERTPHVHAVIVPLTKEGKLSAKEVLRSPKVMRDMHTSYAKAVEHLGLERGKERMPGEKKIEAKTLNEFYHQIQRGDEARKINMDVPTIDKPKTLDLIRMDKWVAEKNEMLLKSFKKLSEQFQDQMNMKAFKTVREIQVLEKYQTDTAREKALKDGYKEMYTMFKEMADKYRQASKDHKIELDASQEKAFSKRDKQWHNALAQNGLKMDNQGNINIDRGRDRGQGI